MVEFRRFLPFILLGLVLLALPRVYAQTTSISELSYPDHALLGHEVKVTFTLTYSMGSGSALAAVILYKGMNTYATGSGTSSPDACLSLTGSGYENSAFCDIGKPQSPTGTEYVIFELKFPSPGVYNLRAGAAIVDSSSKVISGSITAQDFSITIADKVQLSVNTPSSVTVSVDGTPQPSGSVSLSLSPGTHTVSVPPLVQVDSSTRLRFDHWDDGSADTTRTLDLENDSTLTAVYTSEYLLTLVSTEANATGGGWYPSGSVATFSVPSNSLIWTFAGWYESQNQVAASSSGSIKMDSPHTLTARWGLDYFLLGGIIGAIVIVAIVVSVLVRRKSRAAGQFPVPRQGVPIRPVPAGVRYCVSCGRALRPYVRFCNKCGAPQPQSR